MIPTANFATYPDFRLGKSFIFFFSNTRVAYHCIKTKKKLIHCSITTQMERTPDGHKPASQLNTTRKINSHMNYSYPAQPKRLALSVALSQCSIPQRESSYSCSSTSETDPAMRPCGAVEVRERNSPQIARPKPRRVEAHQPSWLVSMASVENEQSRIIARRNSVSQLGRSGKCCSTSVLLSFTPFAANWIILYGSTNTVLQNFPP